MPFYSRYMPWHVNNNRTLFYLCLAVIYTVAVFCVIAIFIQVCVDLYILAGMLDQSASMTGVIILFRWQPNVWISLTCVVSHLHAPNAWRVVQGRIHLAHLTEIANIPHVQTVVVVDAGQPAVGGVIGHGNCVGIPDVLLVVEEVTVKRSADGLVGL